MLNKLRRITDTNDLISNLNQSIPFNSDLFEHISKMGFGEIYLKNDIDSGLRAIIAIHSTKNGPALGGCRFNPYSSTYEAINDALRLARTMSLKSAVIGIPFGGGKSVLIQEPEKNVSRSNCFKSFGQFVHSLNGKYITSVDSGTTLEDMDIIATQTPYVVGTSQDISPSIYTAKGIFIGMKAALKHVFKNESFTNRRIAIQGVGEVGHFLCELLSNANAQIIISDINASHIEQCKKLLNNNVEVVSPDEIYNVACDIFSPCALGGSLNETTIPKLNTKIIAGAANNQLSKISDGISLHNRNILYAPDYIINAGGLIYASSRYLKQSLNQVEKSIENIYETLSTIFNSQTTQNRPANIIADELALSRLNN